MRTLIQPGDNTTIRRYLPFARFVDVLKTKTLWFPRVDQLGDPWELNVSAPRFEQLINLECPRQTGKSRGQVRRDVKRQIRTWRLRTFASCWSSNRKESYALWRIFCRSSKGVAIQTTVGRLPKSFGGHSINVYRVAYRETGHRRRGSVGTRLSELATEKRPPFQYEREIRAVLKLKPYAPRVGVRIPWNPETFATGVLVHPDADQAFHDRVKAALAKYAPALQHRVSWSVMRTSPVL